jgi:hypothetical protein
MKRPPTEAASEGQDMRIVRILQAASVILVAEPSLAADLGPRTHQDLTVPRLHRFAGTIEGTGETLVGSVLIDEHRPGPLPQITVSTSTGTVCSGHLSWSKLGRPVEGAFLCSDGRSAQFWWSVGCAEAFLDGSGDIAGQRFRFQEKDLPSPCKPFDGWLQFRTPPNSN